MAKDLYEGFPEVRELYDLASQALGYDMAKLSFEGPAEELNKTMRTQPCLLAAGMAAFSAISSRGITANAAAGHSLGEYTALVAGEAVSVEDGLRITEARGEIMQNAVPEGKGLMAAVLGLDRSKVDGICLSVKSGYVAPANYNCPGQIVISGEKEAVYEAIGLLKDAGAKRVVPLQVSVPSHSRLMAGAAEKLAAVLASGDIAFSVPRIPVVMNATAKFVKSADEIKSALVKQLESPVLWEDCVGAMARAGIDTFIELGPGKVLSGLIRRCAPDAKVFSVEDRESLARTLGDLDV